MYSVLCYRELCVILVILLQTSIVGFATHILNTGPTPRQGNKSDNAHPPIHPTKYINTLHVSDSSCPVLCDRSVPFGREMSTNCMSSLCVTSWPAALRFYPVLCVTV